MISIILRTTVMFLLVMFSLRMMGKKNLGEFQPSDFVSTMLISNLTSIIIEAPELPILYSVIPILLIVCFEIFTSIIAKTSDKMAHILQGNPKVLIHNGVINQTVMQDLRFTINDILELMRSKDVFYLEEVNLAIVETTGAVSIYTDPNANTNIKKATIPPFDVIVDGIERYYNLDYIGISESKIDKIIQKENVSKENILLLLVDSNGSYNCTLKEIK